MLARPANNERFFWHSNLSSPITPADTSDVVQLSAISRQPSALTDVDSSISMRLTGHLSPS
jgi:hypothetical protein